MKENDNYGLLSSEKIPDCCGSCVYINFFLRVSYKPGPIKYPLCKYRSEPVCVFGICDSFKRKGEFK